MDKNLKHGLSHQSPDSNPPLLQWWAWAQITRHVAFRRGPGAVGQRLMAILIVVILHMHLTAGDQTLPVALATAGWALEERINHRHEMTTEFLTGNTGDFCPYHITKVRGGDLQEWWLWSIKYCKLTFYNYNLKAFNIRYIRHSLSESHLSPFPCDPDVFTGVVVTALYVWRSDLVHTVHFMNLLLVVVHTLQGSSPLAQSTRFTALWLRQNRRCCFYKDAKLCMSGIRREITTFIYCSGSVVRVILYQTDQPPSKPTNL